ncbi:trypsin-like serine peptidase [Streptomyces sp. NPDC059524]|uniref:trypsin-like serine peptidase n=1 Tax=Streptomyces sp. NPDC059524 TaxID=3346856 RepID=UPI0036C039CF
MNIRTSRRAAAALLSLALLPATLAGATVAQARTPSPEPKVTVGEQTTDPQKVRDFWTAERVQEALANEKKDQAAFDRKSTAATGESRRRPVEQIRPAQSAPAVSGRTIAPLAAGSVVPEMPYAQPVPFPQSQPAVMVGKILFTAKDGTTHGCTGSSIVTANKNTVWTAGHCVHPGDGSGAEGFYNDIVFIPGFKKNDQAPEGYDAPWGEWAARAKVAPTAWTADGDMFWGDMAAFTVVPPAGYTNLTDTLGAFGYKFGSGPDWSDIIDAGFPGDGYQRTDMDGFTQFYCTGNAQDATPFFPVDDRLEVDCDMGHGASGGPMSTPEGQIVGANSHGEEDSAGNISSALLYSSAHADNAIDVINQIGTLS